MSASQRSDSRVPGGASWDEGTQYEATGHPILLPGNPRDGSVVMVAESGAEQSCFSRNQLAMIPSPVLGEEIAPLAFQRRDWIPGSLSDCRLTVEAGSHRSGY